MLDSSIQFGIFGEKRAEPEGKVFNSIIYVPILTYGLKCLVVLKTIRWKMAFLHVVVYPLRAKVICVSD